MDDLRLGQTAQRSDDSQSATKRSAGHGGELTEECRCGVGERVAAKRTYGDDADVVPRAKDGGIGQQKKIAARKTDRHIGRSFTGDASAGGTPVVAVKVAHGKIEDGE